ncbi:hypothetical protein PR729_10105 [Providencia rettgeri]|nr:hypothetical protein PR729_10105 [Providencia rettgeri]
MLGNLFLQTLHPLLQYILITLHVIFTLRQLILIYLGYFITFHELFFELKPYSVAYNFSAYMDVGMGFALTPLTESLCAFRGLGPYIFPLIFTIIIYIIYKLSKKYPYIYILLISMVMDINRGEISYFINNIIFMFFIWYCLERVNKSK